MSKRIRLNFCGRPDFRDWVDAKPDPGWPMLPLTHVTSGVVAKDIIRSKSIKPHYCSVFGTNLTYFFYGRPAYRLAHDQIVRSEAICPYCFIIDPKLLKTAIAIFAFDTGAYEKRLYKHITVDEMRVQDFCLDRDHSRINKLIAYVFSSLENYLKGDLNSVISADIGSSNWDFHPRTYLELLNSKGRNEPDDRICSIEIIHSRSIALLSCLRAVVVPHTVWNSADPAPWLTELADAGVLVAPYLYVPGRHAEHYHTLMEVAVEQIFRNWGLVK